MDRYSEAKAFDDTKTGVKGLVDSGIKEIPSIFHASPAILTSLKAPPSKVTVPTVDLKGGDRRSVVEKIGEAAEKWGFFQVINHGVPLEVMERMIEGALGFHEQDSQVKKQFYSRDHHTRDFLYFSNLDLMTSSVAGWRDSFVCYTAPDPPRPDDLPPVLREILMDYSKQITKLGEFIIELLSEALGLKSNHLKEIGCTKSVMLAGQYYPPCPQPDLAIGIKKHSDFSFITLLLQNKIGALQVLHDQTWVDVPPLPGALVINIGDLLQLISNDKFISAEHRVIAHKCPEPRISVPCLFTTFMKENPQVYEPIKELLSEQNPPKYRDTSYDKFSNYVNTKDIPTRWLLRFKI